MAPSRRKGVSKAAAAAAARRQWKVGDLVLAKVKGFPAWPATVSEPEKWGYSNDWKKVLVYFFGTQQIAFCNPADVEAFTEEKKQSLLVKRQGKGADFVRAVQEIVDSYEKLKKETQLDVASCGGNVADANVSSPVNSTAKDKTDAPELTQTLPIESSNSVIDRHELVCAAEDDSAAVLRDESHNKEASLEEPAGNVASVQSPKPVTYSSRKRSAGDLCPQGGLTQRHTPVRRSRSSSRVQNFVLPCSDGGKSTGNPSTNATQSAPVRKNKRGRKSPDLSGCNDFDSSAFVSNGSMEDNSSEILTIDSDAFSLNDGSAIDSNFKLEHTENIECSEEVELNKGFDLEMKAVVNKKKRKPNRKRATNGASKPTSRLEKETCVQNTSQSSQDVCGNSKERCFEQDGDEHLPLVKRLRVRMGKSSSTEAELNSNLQDRVKSCKEDINSPQQMITSSNCENGSSADGDSSVLNGTLDNVSPSKLLAPCSNTQVCTAKKDQTFCFVDGEAALPPSKRLHRALEAMSANAAEEGQAHVEGSSSIMTSSGMCCISAVKRCPCMANNNQEDDGLCSQKSDTCGIDSSHINLYNLSTNSNPMISTVNTSSELMDEQLVNFQQHETGKDILPGAADQIVEELSDHVVCQTANADLKIQLHGHISPNLDSKCCVVGSNQDSPDPSLPPNDEDNITTVNNSNTASDASEHNGISLQPAVDVNKNDIILPQNNIDMPHNEVAFCEDTNCLKPAVGDVNKANDMSVVVKEIKCKGPEEDMNSVSTSDNCLGEKGNLAIRSSPSLTDGGDCVPQGSPPNTSVCNVSTSDSSNILQNGSCSPDVHLHQKQTSSGPVDGSKNGHVATQQSRSMGKSTEAGRAALLYFEAMLGTLTRTKESIGRATRIAIDCAKFGIAAKVMEILAHNLETESSMHRRVDLFFLVDSIAQSSRGLKGDVCGVYPSAIQAVLPRLLSAAAPPGNSSQENRRQCLKVLRLWLERKILPESIIRHHIRELDVYVSTASAGVFSRRTLRTERALDDPIREMEGMLVDEYGSNSSFQLPGFCMPRMLKDDDEGSDSDEGNFEAVTPEHNSEIHEMTSTIEKHRHILEDVDVNSKSFTDSQTVKDNPLHSMAQPLAAPRSSQPISDPVHYKVPEYREMQMHMPESTSSFNSFPVPPPDNFRHSDGIIMHNKGYSIRPPHHVPSNQFSFVHEEQHMKHRREVPPPPSYSNRQQFVQNMERENFYNNHERLKPPPYDCRERWNVPAPYSGPRYQDKAVPAPYGCHPCESTRIPGHGWRFPPRSMNHRNSMPFRPPFEDAIPVANRGPSFWQPR
ncbi:RNA polymerase II-binding domain [Sesbania bispinosa]|nr:RNA polymerase II-binding domain [Sesbania bispinosa]